VVEFAVVLVVEFAVVPVVEFAVVQAQEVWRAQLEPSAKAEALHLVAQVLGSLPKEAAQVHQLPADASPLSQCQSPSSPHPNDRPCNTPRQRRLEKPEEALETDQNHSDHLASSLATIQGQPRNSKIGKLRRLEQGSSVYTQDARSHS
jgi:hypothetical protein